MSELAYNPTLGLLYRTDPKSCDIRIAVAAVNDYSSPSVSASDVVLDLGAHIGSAARTFLRQGARVVCVEPDAGNVKILRRNVAGTERASVIHAAVAPAGVSFVGLWRHPERNAVHRTMASPDRLPPVEVPAISLETLLQSVAPTVIKCDIEHAEHELPMLRALPLTVRLLFIEIHGTPEQIRDLDGAIRAQGLAAVRYREQHKAGGVLFGVNAAYQRGGV